MRVTHQVNLLDSVREEERGLLEGRYRVYWTRLTGFSVKSFGVVDIVCADGQGYGVVLDAQQSNGRNHAIRVAAAANNLHATAELLGLSIVVQDVKS